MYLSSAIIALSIECNYSTTYVVCKGYKNSTMNNSHPLPNLYYQETEQALLGAVLINPEAYFEVSDLLETDDFYLHHHRWIWHAITRLINSQTPLDILTLSDELEKAGKLAELGGVSYLASLAVEVPSSLHAAAYAKVVHEYAGRRKLTEAASQIAQAAHKEDLDFDQVLDAAEQAIFKISQSAVKRGPGHIGPMVAQAFEYAEKCAEQPGPSGIPTGLVDLDRLTDGLQKSDLIILAGRPGMGKTAFALGVALQAAQVQRQRVAIFSLEMNHTQLVYRLAAQETGLDLPRLRAGRLEAYEWTMFEAVTQSLAQAPIYLDDTPALTPSQLRSRCRKLALEKELGLIIVDYLQLMAGGERFENRTLEVGHISRQLKLLARELEVPILATAQLSRAVEQRQDKRPVLADLRESGSIEQDADLVLFLYRPNLYAESSLSEAAELILAKQRNGPTGVVDLRFQANCARFLNAES